MVGVTQQTVAQARQDGADTSELEMGKDLSSQSDREEDNIRDCQSGIKNPNTTQYPFHSMSALEIIDQVPEFARLVALEIRKNLTPHEDEISTNEAYRRYGRAWVENWTRLRQLHPQYHGSKKMYSISELERVKAKENESVRLVIKK